MAVNVAQQDVPKLMVGALAGAGVLFLLIVVLNHAHVTAGAKAEV